MMSSQRESIWFLDFPATTTPLRDSRSRIFSHLLSPVASMRDRESADAVSCNILRPCDFEARCGLFGKEKELGTYWLLKTNFGVLVSHLLWGERCISRQPIPPIILGEENRDRKK